MWYRFVYIAYLAREMVKTNVQILKHIHTDTQYTTLKQPVPRDTEK